MQTSLDSLNDILRNLFNWILQLASIFFLLSIVISAMRHPFSGKDKNSNVALKNVLAYSILGLIATVSLLVMLYAIKDVVWGCCV